MIGVNLEFKLLDGGRVWPPIVSDGALHGYAREGGKHRVELFTVKPEGIFAAGIHLLWSDMDGVSITGRMAKIHSGKYASGGIEFVLDGVELVDDDRRVVRVIDGYSVGYCLLNRIAYEQQMLVDLLGGL
ncbi:hypothetical protein [Aquipseudomonas alcaligenes]|uniref:hypothetical protein n=1 Tax=Aquipseudomonas alcaligenes TaxID=43263 RepID=UPI0009F81AB7|nr:hypothetical protein [Pseudomonas alcaligenes]